MKNALIIHGMPSKEEYLDRAIPRPEEAHWFPWLKKQLEQNGIAVDTPEMPEPYAPVYEKWQEVFEQLHVDEETILIGHSCGAGFLVRWLSEHDTKVGQVILVAPWLDLEKEIGTDFFNFTIDQNLCGKTVHGITVFYSTDDDESILNSVEKITSMVPGLEIRAFTNKGHFTSGDGVAEFPELLKCIR